MTDLYPLLPIATGLVVLVFLFRHVRFSVFLARNGARAEGVIVGYRETSTSSRMVVRFLTEDGRQIFATHDSTGWTASRNGDPVVVLYDPGRPDQARIVDAPWLSNWVRMMFGLLAVALIAVGMLFAVVTWG